VEADAALGQDHVLEVDPLGDRVVAGQVQADLVEAQVGGAHALAAGVQVQIGHEPLEHEGAPGASRRATPAKQRTWSSWVSRAKKVLKTT
jgi:hypothetical protein